MFCYNCSKKIKDNTKFCQYCGARQPERLAESEADIRDVKHTKESKVAKEKDSSNFIMTGLIFVAGIVIIALLYVLKNYHTCGWCDKAFVGTAYYDAMDSDVIICEDCARDYYWGLDYTRFRLP